VAIVVRSFAKINLGLKIGRARADGFHELRTIYQTLALHDVIHVDVQPGSGIEIRCDDPRVPLDKSNTCYRVAERMRQALPQGLKPASKKSVHGTAEAVPFQSKILIEIEKQLPVQGGLGAASSNAVVTMLALERALGLDIPDAEKLRIAAEVGSDLPLFLIGGTVLGVGRGEEVHPLADLPTLHMVVVTPPVGISTPAAFARWDALVARDAGLTGPDATGTMKEFGQAVFAWLSEPASGVPAAGGDRAETPLLDLVRAGIENDFERVVFPEYPELREGKRVLEREGAHYASLSGSGSTLYGLFGSCENAQGAARRMRATGHAAVATTTLTRQEYWRQMFATNEQLATGK
jgi:4-diphosphocytidyl-2-C-methyl-D-erythritol kinase